MSSSPSMMVPGFLMFRGAGMGVIRVKNSGAKRQGTLFWQCPLGWGAVACPASVVFPQS